jgi:predicted component of type VI protein secretion system
MKDAYTKEVEKKFADILSKVKKGYLSPDEKVTPGVNPVLEVELAMIESLSLDLNQWVEGWKPEGIACRFYTTKNLFKQRHSYALKLHSDLVTRNEPFSRN